MYYGLATSIISSGDGKSPASAYKVIAVDEEYSLMNYFGADLKQQTLQGHCDVMEVTMDGKAATLYFDVTIPLQAEQRQLEPKPGKP